MAAGRTIPLDDLPTKTGIRRSDLSQEYLARLYRLAAVDAIYQAMSDPASSRLHERGTFVRFPPWNAWIRWFGSSRSGASGK